MTTKSAVEKVLTDYINEKEKIRMALYTNIKEKNLTRQQKASYTLRNHELGIRIYNLKKFQDKYYN